MRSTKILVVIALTVIFAVFATVAVGSPLPNGSVLYLDAGSGSAANIPCATGSCFGMYQGPGLVLWTDFAPGTDGGIVLGKDQLPGSTTGGAEMGELSDVWSFFGNNGTFATAPFCGATAGCVTTGSIANTVDNASCVDAAGCAANNNAVGTWHVSWNGVAVPMGSALGCLSVNPANCIGVSSLLWDIEPAVTGSLFELNYAWAVPDGDPSGFGNVPFYLVLRGTVMKMCLCIGVCPAKACNTGVCVDCEFCVYTPVANGTACSDNNGCTLSDTCTDGACVPGTPKVCNDNNPCTSDSCTTTTGACKYTASSGASCTDNNACTLSDTCVFGVCKGTVKNCSDDCLCTLDSCDIATGVCFNTPTDATCGCYPYNPLPAGTKLAITQGLGSAINVPCSVGSCFSMEVAPGTLSWTDFGPGTDNGIVVGKSQMSGGQELAASGTSTTSGELSNAWYFFGAYGTFFTAPDGDIRNIYCGQSCMGADCIGKTELKVFNVAWNGGIIPLGSAAGCTHANCSSDQKEGIFENSYTIDPVEGGAWSLLHTQVVPSGGFTGVKFQAQMRGTVEVAGSCAGAADNTPCDTDGDPCSIERCSLGQCQFDSYLICESAWCALTTCDPAGGCITLEDKCDDGNPCNGREICIGIGDVATCELVGNPPCDDHNVCTTDGCDTATGACTHVNNTLPCDDGNLCNGIETICQDGVCITGTPLNCDDGNVCTTDTCDPATGCVHVAADRSGYIITVAGNGIPGYSGDNGPATSASLYGSNGVTVDLSGNSYIADTSNHRIRKVDTSGTITTVAGNGTLGYSGDNGPATSASLNYPSGVAVDSAGNIYIADQYNNRIRKVDTNGTITTIAGNGTFPYSGDNGPATAASLNHPTGVAVDPSGNIYIADFDHNRIRKVDTSGTITTVAGNGLYTYSGDNGPATSASLFGPFGITIDTAGNIYFADQYNKRIRKVDTSGIITTVAGNGTLGYSGDNGQATSASLYYPTGVAVDTSGNIYIADQYNHRIRKVDTSGIITTVAGNGTSGYSGDNGPATLATLSDLSGVAVDPSGNIFIADTQNNRIRKVTWSMCNSCAGMPEGTPCDDGNACTAGDACFGGVCIPGAPMVCNDNNVCTTDSCNAGVCAHTAIIGCDPKCAGQPDMTPCTLDYINYDPSVCHNDYCSNGVCVKGIEQYCNDNNVCTTDTCLEAAGICVYANNTLPCNDGNCETLNDRCSNGLCMPGPLANCDDGNVCTFDTYDCATKTCLHTNNTLACNDDNACTVNDVCSGGVCAGTAMNCIDGNACTIDSCANGVCVHTPLETFAACEEPGERLMCTTLGIEMGNGVGAPCTAGSCFGMEVAPGFVVWTDFGPGTDGGFVIGKDQANGELSSTWSFFGNDGTFNTTPGGSANLFDSASCSGRMCTNRTVLSTFNVFWGGGTIPMGSASGCSLPSCTPDQMDGVTVSDYQIGGGTWSMSYSSVVPAGPMAGVKFQMIVRGPATTDLCCDAATRCNDNNACTTDTCNSATGACVHTPIQCPTEPCSNDRCDPIIGCIYDPIDCNDNNMCTADLCDPIQGCLHLPIMCNDNNACTTDACDPAKGCIYTLKNFDDNNACTTDSCDAATGVCVHTSVQGCDLQCAGKLNGTPCSAERFWYDPSVCYNDYCSNGVCVMGNEQRCDDNNICTSDLCDRAVGVCTNSPLADGSPCTVGASSGTCLAGVCNVCPAGSVKYVLVRGGGQKPSGADLQVQTSFTVMNAGCIVGSSASSLTCTAGTVLQVNVNAGFGPPPTSATLQGSPIATDTDFMITCTAGEVYKLDLDNKAAPGGKDVDRMTISVQ